MKKEGGPSVMGCALTLAIGGFGLACVSFIPFGLAYSWRAMETMGMGGQVGQLVIVFALCAIALRVLFWLLHGLIIVLKDMWRGMRPVLAPIVWVLRIATLTFFGGVKRRLDRLPYSPKGYMRIALSKVGLKQRVRPTAAPVQERPQGSTSLAPQVSPIPSGDGDTSERERGVSPGDTRAGAALDDADGDDLDDLGAHPEERAHLVAGVVPYGPRGGRKQYVTGIAAKRGSYKSFLLLDLALALLTGGRWMGFLCEHCSSILYVDLELDHEEFARRAKWVAKGRGLHAVPKGWHYLDLSGTTLRVPTEDETRAARALRGASFSGMGYALDVAARMMRALGIENTLSRWGATTQEVILLRARSVGAQAILIDSLTLGGGTSASDEKGWQRLLGGMQFWGLPVVTLDHTSETGHRGMNGSWVKEGLVRSVFEIEREEAGKDLVVTHSKANFSKQRAPFVVRPEFISDDGRIVSVSFNRLPEKKQGPAVPPARATIASLFAQEKPAPLSLPPPAATNGAAKRGQALGERIDADVLSAINAGCAPDKAALAARLPYVEKTCANALSRLRKAGLVPPVKPVVRA